MSRVGADAVERCVVILWRIEENGDEFGVAIGANHDIGMLVDDGFSRFVWSNV
jgi:hypothetical protein